MTNEPGDKANVRQASVADCPVVKLGPNWAPQSYEGGGLAASFRGQEVPPHPSPEDWIGSVTARFENPEPIGDQAAPGQSLLPDGTLLASAITQDPKSWLGQDHLAELGADPYLLVKLLDSKDRLFVHSHPDRCFARTHLGCIHGKTEAWFVLSCRDKGWVRLGLGQAMTEAELRHLAGSGSGEDWLERLNHLTVTEGDVVLVPAGVPHSIGPGVLVLELQEPTDYSVILEHTNRVTRPELGLGWETAIGSVDHHAWPKERLARLIRHWGLEFLDRSEASSKQMSNRGPVSLLPEQADPFFRLEGLFVAGKPIFIDPGYSIILVTEGSGVLSGTFGTMEVSRGESILVAACAGSLEVSGDISLLRARPPTPDRVRLDGQPISRPLV